MKKMGFFDIRARVVTHKNEQVALHGKKYFVSFCFFIDTHTFEAVNVNQMPFTNIKHSNKFAEMNNLLNCN